MKQVIFRLLLCMAALSLLGGRALAAEGTPSLPEEVVRAAPEALYLLWLVLAVDGVFTGALLLRRRDPELLSIGALLSQSRASSQSSTS